MLSLEKNRLPFFKRMTSIKFERGLYTPEVTNLGIWYQYRSLPLSLLPHRLWWEGVDVCWRQASGEAPGLVSMVASAEEAGSQTTFRVSHPLLVSHSPQAKPPSTSTSGYETCPVFLSERLQGRRRKPHVAQPSPLPSSPSSPSTNCSLGLGLTRGKPHPIHSAARPCAWGAPGRTCSLARGNSGTKKGRSHQTRVSHL